MLINNENSLLESLNEPQRIATTHIEGPMVVFAGAGSGKTRIITTRIAYLISKGVRPWEILGVTFTNKAAGEMRSRVEAICPAAMKSTITTFHSACNRWLREFAPILGYDSNFTIYDDNDSTALIKKIIKNNIPNSDAVGLVSSIKSFINSAKTRCILPDDLHFLPDSFKSTIPHGADFIYKEYQKSLITCNAMDFNDLLLNMLLLLRHHKEVCTQLQHRYKFVLVDEFQDTNKAQFELVTTITKLHNNLFVVGDDDQSIYSWRGAIPSNITDFSRTYPDSRTVFLEQNYRCSANIVNAANALISNNKVRASKVLFSQKPNGDLIELRPETDGEMEAFWTTQKIKEERSRFPYDQVAIFYRTNSQSRSFEEFLIKENIPYTIFGSVEFYSRLEIKDILAYLKLLINTHDDVSFRRIVNTPARGIGAKALEKLEELARNRNLSLYEAMEDFCNIEKGAAAHKFSTLFKLIDNFRDKVNKVAHSDLLMEIIQTVDYTSFLKKKYPDQYTDKIENIYELNSALIDFTKREPNATLLDWLQTVTLTRSEDDAHNVTGISLMTLHMAKGLEFNRVFITGLEDGLLPHYNNTDDELLLEEERRLLYVGITRTKIKLTLTFSKIRRLFNTITANPPSRFLDEIPTKFVTLSMDTAQTSLKAQSAFHESDYTYDFNDLDNYNSESFKKTRVYHPTYGKGVVLRKDVHFGKVKLLVDFNDFGERKISPTQLTILDS